MIPTKRNLLVASSLIAFCVLALIALVAGQTPTDPPEQSEAPFRRQLEGLPIILPEQNPANVQWIEVEISYLPQNQLPKDLFQIQPQTGKQNSFRFHPFIGATGFEIRYRLHFQTPSAWSEPPIIGTLAEEL